MDSQDKKRGHGQWASAGFICAIIGALGIVASVSPSEPVDILGVKIHLPNLASVLQEAAPASMSVDEQLDGIEEGMRLEAAERARQDSIENARADSLRLMERVFSHSEGSLRFPGDDFTYLFPVYKAMMEADTASVHVIHYGDSQIEGDRITQILRDSLQSLFGGAGPGMLPLWQPIACRTVRQTLTDSVATFYAAGIMGRRANHDRYGAMAQMAEMRGERVRMRVEALGKGHGGYRRIRAYVGNVTDTMSLALDSLPARRVAPTAGLTTVEWGVAPRNAFSLTLQGRGDVYAIEVNGGKGVSVTNIPMRGADGLFLQRIDQSLMRSMMRKSRTRLIIMEFGGNALPMISDTADVSRYCKGIGGQIDRMKALCPEARIIFIGPADMSVKENGVLQTHPQLPDLTAKLARTCDEHGVAFWDMYDVMGGWNSMIAWVNHQPALAGTDYVHFTTRGANRIAQILWKAIKMNYDYMLLRDDAEREAAKTQRVEQ